MKLSLVLCSILAATAFYNVNAIGRAFSCQDAEVTDVRIENCEVEPCKIKKGKHVPVEVDFSFQKPSATSSIGFSMLLEGWGKLEAYATSLGGDNRCSELLKGQTCPAEAGVPHTLHSSIYINLDSEDIETRAKTAVKDTMWTLKPILRSNDGPSFSRCRWNVTIDIVQ